jgi:hypothetical protein
MVVRWRGIVLVVVLSCSSTSFYFAADEVLVSLLAVAGKFLSAILCTVVGSSAIETEVLFEASLLFFRGDLTLGGFEVGIVNGSGGSFLRCDSASVLAAGVISRGPSLLISVVRIVEQASLLD